MQMQRGNIPRPAVCTLENQDSLWRNQSECKGSTTSKHRGGLFQFKHRVNSLPPPFCSVQFLIRSDDAHRLGPLIQMLLFQRHLEMTFYRLHGHLLAHHLG